MSVSRRARRSPIPTQLNGRTIVYGRPYCSSAPFAKYSEASFWKPYVEIGGGEVELGAFRGREDGRRLVDHRRRHDDDPLQVAVAMGGDRRVERRGEDPLVLGEQVVGELVEVADPADHRGRGDDLVAVGGELRHQRGVLRVALDEAIARVVVVRLRQAAVLAEVVEADDLVARLEQVRDEVAVDEAGGAGDKDLHGSDSSVIRRRPAGGRSGTRRSAARRWRRRSVRPRRSAP